MTRRLKTAILAKALILFLIPNILIAGEVDDKVLRYGIYAGNRDRFPDTEGVGWSNSIPYEIFTAAGYKVELIELPAERLPVAFASGEIDSFVRSKESLRQFEGNFLPSKYPLGTLAWDIYYNAARGWKPVWPPDDEFLSKVGKSKQSANDLNKSFGLNVTQASNFESIFKMVNKSRADYWIDNRSGMRSFTPDSGKTIPENFVFEVIFLRGVYLILRNDEQGRKFHSILHEGMRKFIEEGDYARTYYMNDKYVTNTKTVDDTMAFIRREFPDEIIPEQKQPTAVLRE